MSNLHIVASNKAMKDICTLIDKIASCDINILISGEAGSGKATIAKFIHEKSACKGSFVTMNPVGFIDSSMSDADIDCVVNERFENADKGTLLIDDVTDATTKLQARILKKLQLADFSCRVISASNRDLRALARQKRFRQDLCHRLDVISIEIPPLRERRDDIRELAEIFFIKLSKANYTLADDAIKLLYNYDWPGNVRELENALTVASKVAENNIININHLPSKIRRKSAAIANATVADELYRLAKGFIESASHIEDINPCFEYLKVVEVPLIKASLDLTEGNKSKAANLLKINRNTLNKKMVDYKIER